MRFIKLVSLLIFIVSSFSSVSATKDNKNKVKPHKPTVLKLQTTATDHNSTRSNRGSLVAPTEGNISDKTTTQLKPKKGRNPQTGKEINTSKKRTGRNPQTGKKINIKNTKD